MCSSDLVQGGGMADEDFTAIEKKALKSGAKKVYVVDLQVLDSFKFIPTPVHINFPI